ncbi:MAG: acetolactate synthase small subunit [Lachnospiraceae bacterium]|nr:acetolactate synthase small subunit [Lachnospiraceae bacterium]
MSKMVLSILVENNPGVLSRVAGLFSRRAFNIISLTVGETENPRYSRMTVVTEGDSKIQEQIKKQLLKLEDVSDLTELLPDNSVTRELLLVKVKADAKQRQQIIAVANIFRAKIVDVATEALMIELTGNQAKLNAFLNLLKGYTILTIVRTGVTGLKRGLSGSGDIAEYIDVD